MFLLSRHGGSWLKKIRKINQVIHGNEIKYSLNILTENIIKYMRYLQFLLVSNHCSVSLPTENWIEKKKYLQVHFFLSDVAINWIIKFCLLFGLN